MTDLDNIVDKLKALKGQAQEDAHMEADDLLIEALRVLARNRSVYDVEPLIAAYDAIGKWYA